MKSRLLAIFCGTWFVATAALSAEISVIHREITVDQPAQVVWARVGDYCAIAEWLQVACSYTSGKGEVGTVRLLNNAIVEVMVVQAPLSYTYHQTVGNMAAYGYHGTLAVEATGTRQAKLTYTLVYDQESMVLERRESERIRLQGRFQSALEAMKAIAERP
jgi:hypothetical protein